MDGPAETRPDDTEEEEEVHAAAAAVATPTSADEADPGRIPGLEPAGPTRLPPLIATPAASAEPPSIDDLGPYFAEPPLSEALAAYLAGENSKAARLFGAFVEGAADDVRARPARFLRLLALHDAGEDDVAADLEALAAAWPELADYGWYYAASAHVLGRRWDEAIAAADRIAEDSTLWGRARELRARADVGADRAADAVATLDAVAAKRPGELRSSAWELLAKLRREAKDRAGARDALVEEAVRFASSSAGRGAYRDLGRKPKLDARQRFRLGQALYDAHRHDEALAILAGVGRDDPQWCRARYLEGRTREKKKQFAAAWEQLEKALSCEDDAGVYADATFSGGRNRLKAGDLDAAERLLKAHVARFPERSTVDDCLVMLADVARQRGDEAGADDILMKLVEGHHGDQVDEASWDLLWPRIEAGKVDEALALADQILAVAPRETHYRAEGRVRYWRGRLLLTLGRDDEAYADFERVLVEHPLSWYAVLAYARFVERDPVGAPEELARIVAASEGPPDPLGRIPERLWRDARFRRGLELARMGLSASARRELDDTPDPSGPEARTWLWTKVKLFYTAGAWHLGMRLARGQEPTFGQAWPHGDHVEVWRLAHPRAFAELVERWATAREIPSAWVYSIAREESGFNPAIESWANAIGLMQIIMPTAKMLARGTDIEPTRAALQDPAVAIELGSKYLAKLLGQHPVIPLASAGYNAGGGSVNRWRREFGDRELDEFVERISYHEARGYAKRVTRSVARYTWLYQGRMLVLDLSPPGAPD
ncbi:MAG: tetratricopeptide repeat protein [Deltaproteobacteria bacterium]|nr:MAG: tetratricopeptide repeat protein [Deltaproteobacteria bacterium]